MQLPKRQQNSSECVWFCNIKHVRTWPKCRHSVCKQKLREWLRRCRRGDRHFWRQLAWLKFQYQARLSADASACHSRYIQKYKLPLRLFFHILCGIQIKISITYVVGFSTLLSVKGSNAFSSSGPFSRSPVRGATCTLNLNTKNVRIINKLIMISW